MESLTFEDIKQLFLETREQMKETDKKFRETDKRIKALTDLYTTQWGKLMEALIAPSCLKLFQNRGIDISQTQSRVEIFEQRQKVAEFDIVLANGTEIVMIEVKTTMKKEDVDEFIEKMQNVKKYFPKYAGCKFYGALAAIKYDEQTDKYGYKKGLFVLVNSGEGIIKIANKSTFQPAIF